MVLSKKFAKLPLKFEPYISQMVRSKIWNIFVKRTQIPKRKRVNEIQETQVIV